MKKLTTLPTQAAWSLPPSSKPPASPFSCSSHFSRALLVRRSPPAGRFYSDHDNRLASATTRRPGQLGADTTAGQTTAQAGSSAPLLASARAERSDTVAYNLQTLVLYVTPVKKCLQAVRRPLRHPLIASLPSLQHSGQRPTAMTRDLYY